QRTEKDQQISFSDAQAFCDTKEIESDNCQYDCGPHLPSDLLFQEYSQNRHDHDVTSGDKSCFSCSCVLNSHLLQAAGSKQQDPPGNPSCQKIPASSPRHFLLFRTILSRSFPFPKKIDAWQQCYAADQAPDSIKCKRTEI